MTSGDDDKKKIDVDRLLEKVDIVEVVGRYVKLTKKNKTEHAGLCPFHNEKTPSFTVSEAKQFYHCFGCGAHGNAVGFLMEYSGLSFIDACVELGADVPGRSRSGEIPIPARKTVPAADSVEEKKPRTEWVPLIPVPDDAPPPPVAHIKRGKYTRIWTYRDAEGRVLGYVCRFETSDGGKEVMPLTYVEHPETKAREWRWISFPEKRPLYGLDRLAAAAPDAHVLLVEGEKCADAAQAELPKLVAMSWPGGGKAVDKVDWSPLAGRSVISWADCDAKRERTSKAEIDAGVDPMSKPLLEEEKQPGVSTMRKAAQHVLELGGVWWDVDIPAPGEVPDGWDVADAIEEGMRGDDLANFIRDNLSQRSLQVPEGSEPPSEAGAGEVNKSDQADESRGPFIPDLVWRKGELASCLSNVYQILAHHPKWRGVVAYDEMSLCTVKRKAPPYEGGRVGEWDAQDDSRTAMWLTRNYDFTPSSAMVAEAIEVLARSNAWHPVRTWLRSLKWDGKKRLNHWLTMFVGAKDSPYARRVGAWWLMGAIKRVLQPGAKFDYCLVLSGAQGKGKSTVFEILGGEWFGDTELNIESKDAMSALRGKLIYEIAELGALARSEERRQKSFLSRSVDEYRPVYGRREIKAPRQLVFGGTTNEHEWNKDPTGGRRFWPVDCLADAIDHDGLRAVRDQLFAEALVRIEAGERYWPTAEEQRTMFDPEQLKVEQQDSLVDALHDWVYARLKEFSAYEAANDCLKLDASKLTRDLQTRIGIALRKLGCTRIERRNGMIRYWYKPPERNEAESTSGTPAQQWEDDYVPL